MYADKTVEIEFPLTRARTRDCYQRNPTAMDFVTDLNETQKDSGPISKLNSEFDQLFAPVVEEPTGKMSSENDEDEPLYKRYTQLKVSTNVPEGYL